MVIETTEHFVTVTAESGKVFKSKITGDILTDKLYLGCNDKAENYEEIEMPLEEEVEYVKNEQEPTAV